MEKKNVFEVDIGLHVIHDICLSRIFLSVLQLFGFVCAGVGFIYSVTVRVVV